MINKFLPKEVIMIIYEMNPEHREHFKILKKELLLAGVYSRLRIVDHIFKMEKLDHIDILSTIVNDPEYVLQILSTCDCSKKNAKRKKCDCWRWIRLLSRI